MDKLPRIGIPTDARVVASLPGQMVGDKYIDAVLGGADAVPLLLPTQLAVGTAHDAGVAIAAETRLEGLDGLLLTGSPSNLEPARYGGGVKAVGPFDPARDDNDLSLLRAAFALDLPVLAVCRGFQELNVVCGGTLYTAVQEVPGMLDHREDSSLPKDKQYAPAHALQLTAGGWLQALLGTDRIRVNSLHGQGIHRVGAGLIVEGRAPDGLVEALRHPDYSFVVGVQWHPEWQYWANSVSLALFKAFGRAARAYQERRAAVCG